MARTNYFVFVALIVLLLVPVLGSSGQEIEPDQVQFKKYMETYKNYLKAKINNDPAVDERLKEYNQAYSEYLKFLRVSAPLRKPAESTEPSKTSAAPASGSQVFERPPESPVTEISTSPTIRVEPATTTIIPISSEPVSTPSLGASSTTP